MKKIKASIITKNKNLISELPRYKFNMDTMVTQRSKEAPKTSERIPVSLPVIIPKTQNNTEKRDIIESTAEVKRTAIYQRKIPGQH